MRPRARRPGVTIKANKVPKMNTMRQAPWHRPAQAVMVIQATVLTGVAVTLMRAQGLINGDLIVNSGIGYCLDFASTDSSQRS